MRHTTRIDGSNECLNLMNTPLSLLILNDLVLCNKKLESCDNTR